MDGGTGFCAAPERTENLAHLINSLFGWDLFGLVTSCVKVGQNSTPKYHCPHVRSVSKCPKCSVITRIREKTGKIRAGNALGRADLFLAFEALCSAVISAIPNPIQPTHTQPVLPEINWIWGDLG